MRRQELRSGYPAAAASVFAFTYIACLWDAGATSPAVGRRVLPAVFAAGGLGGRHLRVLVGKSMDGI